MTFHRYVALGDSFTEGVGDPDPTRPNGLRGWADRVAEVLAARTDDFGYANLAIRGRKLDGILAEQLEPALALEPDLVTIYAGANDILRPARRPRRAGRRVRRGARPAGRDRRPALVWTAFDPGGSAIYRPMRGRFALYNELVRESRRPPRRDDRRLLADARLPRLAAAGTPTGCTWARPATSGWRSRCSTRSASRTTWCRQLPRAAATLDPARALRAEPRLDPLVAVPWVHRRLTGRSSGDDRRPRRRRTSGPGRVAS